MSYKRPGIYKSTGPNLVTWDAIDSEASYQQGLLCIKRLVCICVSSMVPKTELENGYTADNLLNRCANLYEIIVRLAPEETSTTPIMDVPAK